VTDGGEPKFGVPPDFFDAEDEDPGQVDVCDETEHALFQILQGNIVVNDGTRRCCTNQGE
jgi:hypothetical protein